MYIYFFWVRHMISLTTKVGMILTEGEALSFSHQGVDWTAARKTSATSLVGRKFSIGFEERSSASFSYEFFFYEHHPRFLRSSCANEAFASPPSISKIDAVNGVPARWIKFLAVSTVLICSFIRSILRTFKSPAVSW